MSRKKRADLDALIAEATVDCYNDSECVTGGEIRADRDQLTQAGLVGFVPISTFLVV